ncbi:MAG: LysE family transporter [Pseudomonadota bacterium]
MTADLPNLLVAWSIQATGVLSPGPGVAFILGVATRAGRAPALAACLGIGLGALVLAILTVLGFAAILAESRPLLIAVRWIGAAYLAWLAISAFRRAISPPPPPMAAQATDDRSLLGRIFAGFIFQIANPKAIFFWIAVAAVGALDAVSTTSLLIFLVGALLISSVGHGGWAIVLSSTPFRALYTRARRWIEAALGTFFGLFAMNLAAGRS